MNRIRRRLTKYRTWLLCAPALLRARPVPDIVLVTGSDESHFRSLQQFLRSAKTWEPGARLVVYDLGLSGASRGLLRAEWPGLDVREFPFAEYPPHLDIRVKAGEYAWKPVIVAEVMAQYGLPVVWMDAGNVVLSPLRSIRKLLASSGFYSPHSKGTVGEWTHPGMLASLDAYGPILRRQNLNGACVAVNPSVPRVRALVEQWRDLALVKACIAPPGSDRSNHRQDQSLLTVLAYQAGLGGRSYPYFLGFAIHQDIDGPNRPSQPSRA